MELQWILVVVSIVIIAMIAWHSSNATLSKMFSWLKPNLKRKHKPKVLFEIDSVATPSHAYSSHHHEFFEDELSHDDDYFESPQVEADPLENIVEEKRIQDDVFIIHLKAKSQAGFGGEQLLIHLNRAGLHFGEMDIFHYDQTDVSGKHRLFSLASSFEPGIFDIDRMEHFQTTGLTFFMQASQTDNPRNAFETMLEVGERLAMSLNAQMCDQHWEPLNEFTIEQYYNRLREPARAHAY